MHHKPVALRSRRVFSSGVTFLRCLFLLGALSLLPGCGREEAQAEESMAAKDAKEGAGSVWVVDRPGKPGQLFLCGTIHILRAQDYPLSPGYEAAYNQSDKIVLELPPGSGSGPAMASRMKELGLYPADTSLEAHVSPETWQSVKNWSQKRGLGASEFSRFRPWFVSLIITATEYATLGAKPDMGVDQHFEERARRDRKPAIGLETVEFQLQLFAQLTADQQSDMLEQTLGEISTLPQEYDKMIEAWKHGRLEDLHDMLFREAAKFPELMDLFLTSRNLSWIDRLDGLLKRGEKAMILVGTGHFAAEKGLIQLLKDRGYRVRHHSEVEAP